MSFKTDFSKIDLDKYYFDEKDADLAVRYIETNIRHVSGPLSGQLLKLEDWQKDEIIRPLFGWLSLTRGVWKKNVKGEKVWKGYRKYTETHIEIPKKNGKTFLAASVVAIFLDMEPEPGVVPMFSIAGSKDQARLTFDATASIITQSKRLSQKAKIYKHAINVGEGHNRKYLQALASISETQQGVNGQLVIVDELHIHKKYDLIENQRKSQIARNQPLFFKITTAGVNLYGVGYAERTYAEEVVKGIREDENLLVCVYCADKDDDPLSKKTWAKANPNLGISVTIAGLEREIKKAKFSSTALNSFLRYHLNIWTASKDQFISDILWNECFWDVTDKELAQYPCYGGLDLSSTSDITAFSLVFKTPKGYVSKNWFFLPDIKGRDSADKNNTMYLDWVKNEFIIETPSKSIDYDFVLDLILNLAERFNILGIAYDPYHAPQIVPKIEAEGLDVVSFRQGWKTMTAPIGEFERLIIEKEFNHLNNPVLKWMNGNTQKWEQNNAYRLIKDELHPEKKIDGMITNVMAIGLWVDPDEQKNQDSYLSETKGKIFSV